MFLHRTLATYLLKLYSWYFCVVSLVICSAFILSNIFDITQRYKAFYIPSNIFVKLILLKVPYLYNETVALVSLISMLFFLRRLTKYNEMLIILNSGVPIWRVLMAPLFATLIFGIVITTVINPVSALSLSEFEHLENKVTKKKPSDVLVSQSGIMVVEDYNNERRIIATKLIEPKSTTMQDVTILFIGQQNDFLKRIDAKTARLMEGKLLLLQSKVHSSDKMRVNEEEISLPTSLSISNFTESLSIPEKISFWQLPELIKRMTKSGLPVGKYKLYYLKQLFKPLLMIVTIFLACCFLDLKQRDNSSARLFASGLIVGFLVYSLMEVSAIVLMQQGIAPALALLIPLALIFLVSNFVILHLHEA